MGPHTMGYDCTLHLVDEDAIRTQFIPRLLGTVTEAPPPSFWQRLWRRMGPEPATTIIAPPLMALDRYCRDADRRFRRARLSLTKRDPGTAAQYVCELAILYASAEMPFTCSRNLALSLWHWCQPSVMFLRIYYPADGSWASLSREMFAFREDDDRFSHVFWSEPTDLVIAQRQWACHAVPARAVLDLERSAPAASAVAAGTAAKPRPHDGYVMTTEAASAYHDRVAALSPCYLADVEARMDALLQKNTSPRPPRPFRLGLAIGADGALTDASVIGTQPDALAAKIRGNQAAGFGVVLSAGDWRDPDRDGDRVRGAPAA
jgi:hypothetical protein